MAGEPRTKRAIAFVDGQNLFYAARASFGHRYPNCDPVALARTVCARQGWQLRQVRHYPGIPAPWDDPIWHSFWRAKFAAMGRQGVHVVARTLRYRWHVHRLKGGSVVRHRTREEKGIDVRIAIDVIRLAEKNVVDVVLLFSQDQDLAEAAREIRGIAREHGRWIKVASAFPRSERTKEAEGIDETDWIPIDRATYDACVDPRDDRPRSPVRGPEP